MRVVVDRVACTGHGRCYSLEPALFVDDDAGYGTERSSEDLSGEALEAARRAVLHCPEHAIELVE